MWLAWIKGPLRPYPVIWHDTNISTTTGKEKKCLQYNKLTDADKSLGLDVLSWRYPLKQTEGADDGKDN